MEIHFVGQIPDNGKLWGYVPMFESDFEDFKKSRSIKMSEYTHPMSHQTPEMAFKFAIMQEIEGKIQHTMWMQPELFVIGF